MNYKKSYCFDDVLLVPQMSEINSRSEINLSAYLDKSLYFGLPIISSPMDTVTGSEMITGMSRNGGLGIAHRYNTIADQAKMIKDSLSKGSATAAGAVGVSGDFVERACELRDSGAVVICVDIAHGHHVLMRYALEVLKNTFGSAIHIMAGNVATLEAFNDLADWGADSVRVGIGGGSICSTRVQTGHGMPTLQSIFDCSQSDRDVALIADGGIRNSGDIVKSLAAGADFVMLGSLLAKTEESQGEVFYLDGHKRKVYRGMASKDAQIDWRGHTASVEGVTSSVCVTGTLSDVLGELETGIRSGLSYSGARTIRELQSKARFTLQTSSGAVESSTHIIRN